MPEDYRQTGKDSIESNNFKGRISWGRPSVPETYSTFGGQWGYRTLDYEQSDLVGHRVYNSGRFLTRDSTGYAGGMNLYESGDDGPTGEVDPAGLAGWYVDGGHNDLSPNFDGLQSATDFFAGWGNVLSGGLTGQIGNALGTSEYVQTCSGDYGAGEGIGAVQGVALALVGDEAVDEGPEEALQGALERAKARVPQNIPNYGTKLHTALADEIRMLGRDDLHAEVSYLNQLESKYGALGSVRVDVVIGDRLAPNAIYDLKTGGATLTPSRIGQIQQALPSGFQSIPVIELR